jgi:hypothetical protein
MVANPRGEMCLRIDWGILLSILRPRGGKSRRERGKGDESEGQARKTTRKEGVGGSGEEGKRVSGSGGCERERDGVNERREGGEEMDGWSSKGMERIRSLEVLGFRPPFRVPVRRDEFSFLPSRRPRLTSKCAGENERHSTW